VITITHALLFCRLSTEHIAVRSAFSSRSRLYTCPRVHVHITYTFMYGPLSSRYILSHNAPCWHWSYVVSMRNWLQTSANKCTTLCRWAACVSINSALYTRNASCLALFEGQSDVRCRLLHSLHVHCRLIGSASARQQYDL